MKSLPLLLPFLLILLTRPQEQAQPLPDEAGKLIKDLGSEDINVREQATIRLMQGYDKYKKEILLSLNKPDGLDAETGSRLKRIVRGGPGYSESYQLHEGLSPPFVEKNKALLDLLLCEKEDAFCRAVEDLCRGNPDNPSDLTHCLLFAFHRACTRACYREWSRGLGLQAAGYRLRRHWVGQRNRKVTEFVRRCLRHGHDRVAAVAIPILGMAGGPVAREGILEALGDPRPNISEFASNWTTQMQWGEDIPRLRRVLALGNANARASAVVEIARIAAANGDRTAVPVITQTLGTDQPAALRARAIDALVILKAKEQSKLIAGLVNDKEEWVRRQAIQALGRLEAHDEAALLVPLLAKEEGGPHWPVSRSAYHALKNLRSEDAARKLADLLRSSGSQTKTYALQLLGEWEARNHADNCVPALKDGSDQVRSAALDTLGLIGKKDHAAAAAQLLNDDSEEVRCRAAICLGRLKASDDIPRIIELADNGTISKHAAVESILHSGSTEHAGTAGRLLSEIAEGLPDLQGQWLPHNKEHASHMRFKTLLDMAVTKQLDPCLERVAMSAVNARTTVQNKVYYALAHSRNAAAAEALATVVSKIPPEAHSAAAAALGAGQSPAAVKAILKIAEAADPTGHSGLWNVRSYARRMCGVPQHFVPFLNDKNPQVRTVAAVVICESHDARYLPQILGLLKDPDQQVRVAVIYGLRTMPTQEHYSVFRELLKDPDISIRRAALSAVKDLEIAECAADVGKLLDENDHGIRYDALFTLGKLRHDPAVEAVSAFLKDRKLHHEAAYSLECIGSQSAAEALSKAARGPGISQAWAIRTLAKMGKGDLVPDLKPLLDNPDEKLRAEAAFAAGELGRNDLKPALVERLNDDSIVVRAEAGRALARLGSREFMEEIVSLLELGAEAEMLWDSSERCTPQPDIRSFRNRTIKAVTEALVELKAAGAAGRIARMVEEERRDSFLKMDLIEALIQLDAKKYMSFILSNLDDVWPKSVYYRLNSIRAPDMYRRIASETISDVRLLKTGTYEDLFRRLETANGFKILFGESVPQATRTSTVRTYGLHGTMESFLEVYCCPGNCAVLLDEQEDVIRIVTREQANRFWLEWAGKD